MRRTSKRIAAIVLALVLVAGLMPNGLGGFGTNQWIVVKAAETDTQPTGGEAQPADEKAQPTGEEAQSTNEGTQLAGEEAQPTDEGTQPAGEEAQPTDEGTQPTGKEAQPTDEENQPTGEDTQPTEEQAPYVGALGYIDIEEEHVPVSVAEYDNYIPANYGVLQEKYDPRSDSSFKSYVPEIRNQNPLGTCWAHSALNMLEMGLAKNKHQKLDLSEYQLAYYFGNDRVDPLGLCTNDRFYKVTSASNKTIPADYYDGGNSAYTQFVLMGWVGAVSETQYPDTAYSQLLAHVNNNTTPVLDPSYAVEKDAVHMQESIVLNSKDKDTVKQMVLNHGSVGISYYDASKYRNYANKSYYNSANTSTNHAVAIVGWDDNFDKSKFNDTPPNDGAWLIRNSWGNYYGGDNGYFWISYDDTSLAPVAYVYRGVSASDSNNWYKHNYQYDGGIGNAGYPYSGSVSMANVFTAQGKETLSAVSFYCDENTKYEIKIYKNLTNTNTPDSGTAVSSISGTQEYQGYHTVPLSTNVSLAKGDVFSVVVTLTAQNSGTYTHVYVDYSFTSSWICNDVEALQGQSFVKSSSSWTDTGKSWGENVRIKAYTIDSVSSPINTISLSSGSKTIKVGDTFEAKDLITTNIKNSDDAVIYSSDDSKIATVSEEGTVVGIRPGTTNIKLKARAGTGSATITVVVEPKSKATAVSFDVPEINISIGSSKLLSVNITPSDCDDYPSFTSSDSKIAKVDSDGTVTGVSKGTAEITATTYDGLTATCKVTVSERSGETIKCYFNKIPNKIYKYSTINIKPTPAMTKLKPTSIEWASSSANLSITGNETKEANAFVNNADTSNKKGEKVTITATVHYIKTTKKQAVEKTKVFKKKTSLFNLSYDIDISQSKIVSSTKGEKFNLTTELNEGKSDDQPTNKSVKWAITTANGKKDSKGSKIAGVNSKGIVTTKGPGTTYVTAYAADSYDKKKSNYKVFKTIAITCTPVSTVSFSEESATLEVLGTISLKEKLVFNDGKSEPFNKEKMKLEWSTNSKNNVTVNSAGVAKVTKNARAGSYTITVKAVGGVPKGAKVPSATFKIIVPKQEQPKKTK